MMRERKKKVEISFFLSMDGNPQTTTTIFFRIVTSGLIY
jgi:hypothetical protein